MSEEHFLLKFYRHFEVVVRGGGFGFCVEEVVLEAALILAGREKNLASLMTDRVRRKEAFPILKDASP
jgi:hypothetical protein